MEFNAYEPLIGMELNSIHIMRATVSFQFSNPDNRHVDYDIHISTSADLCIREDEFFKPANEYDIIRSTDIPALYLSLIHI